METCKIAAIRSTYISSGCNRTSNCCDWGHNGLICFGSCNSVALYKSKGPSIISATFVEHKDRVNSVKWIQKGKNEGEIELVSASQDKTSILWRMSGDCLEAVSRLEGHLGSVTLADGVYVTSAADMNRLLVATASTDSTVKIWERKDEQGDFLCKQTLSHGQSLTLSLAWVVLPGANVPLLACALDDLAIHLYIEENDKFLEVQTLVGHEEWIRGLDFTVDDSGDVLLASCSQDTYIRLWRFSKFVANSSDGELRVKEKTFTIQSQDKSLSWVYRVTLESVLQGHDNWVMSAQWQSPVFRDDGTSHQPMSILSASMDKTLIVWQPSHESGIWTEKSRVGEIGGSNLGFYGGLFSPDGSCILAHGFHGAFHLWSSSQDSSVWQPEVTCGGHFGPVQDIAWNGNGEYLLSVSSDQTSRLHGYWMAKEETERSWHEIARPQIHGYDLQCLAMLDRFSFVSGADEKVVRIFKAPKNFLENFRNLSKANVEDSLKQLESSHLAEGASVPALGLSNKAVYADETKTTSEGQQNEKLKEKDQYAESYFTRQELIAPPTEENLLQNTLWPEVQKLYGHGYEIYALACHPKGTVLASACKASKPEHASIILWDSSNWRMLGKLDSHSLTITQIQFSHSGEFLLSVSRDRTWSLFQETSPNVNHSDELNSLGPSYKRIAYSDKKTSIHGRIIWSCAWSHDDRYFITVSRDKKAVLWGNAFSNGSNATGCLGSYRSLSHVLELSDCITAVDFAPSMLKDQRYLLAFGLESGSVLLYSWLPEINQSENSWVPLYTLSQSRAHHLTIKRLKFRPIRKEPEECKTRVDAFELASCGEDNCVKIFEVVIV